MIIPAIAQNVRRVNGGALVAGGGGGGEGTSGLYFNSMEATGPNDVLTDDFWRGSWYEEGADDTPNYHNTTPGWGGGMFTTPYPPTNGAVVNLAAIGKKPLFTQSDYVATTGISTGGGNYNAWHNLSGGGSGGYSEIFWRVYLYFVEADFYGANDPADDYEFGAEKVFTVFRWNDDGGLYWCGTGLNVAGGPDPFGRFKFVNNHGTNDVFAQNQGADIDLLPGRWYYVENRYKLNTLGNADGVWQMWINDGGATGDFDGQTPTLRASYSNIDFGYDAGETELFGAVWFENWANSVDSPSTGEHFWANVKVATDGPIGFAA